MNEEQMLAWLDNASDEDLLRLWRFTPLGSKWFEGRIGDKFSVKVSDMRHFREMAGTWTELSKKVGWGRQHNGYRGHVQ